MKTQSKVFLVKTGERGGDTTNLRITVHGYPADSAFSDAFGEHAEFAAAMFNDGLLYRSRLAKMRQATAEAGETSLEVEFVDLTETTPRGGPSKADKEEAAKMWAKANLDALESDVKRADRIRAWAASTESKKSMKGLADLVPDEVSDDSIIAQILKLVRVEADRRARAGAATDSL